MYVSKGLSRIYEELQFDNKKTTSISKIGKSQEKKVQQTHRTALDIINHQGHVN